MIRRCGASDLDAIFDIINEAADAYRGVIADDCWHEPYMPAEALRHEIEDGVVFFGFQQEGRLVGVMGIQDKGEVTLIRHAYVRCSCQQQGIGARLLRHLESLTGKPILIGTWADAAWAISFYQKNGYDLVSQEEKNRLLKKYWSIPPRQIETSVVLAKRESTRSDGKRAENPPG
jgi:N-acetylglutamate synthase-like GNAT family acetyltransferase